MRIFISFRAVLAALVFLPGVFYGGTARGAEIRGYIINGSTWENALTNGTPGGGELIVGVWRDSIIVPPVATVSVETTNSLPFDQPFYAYTNLNVTEARTYRLVAWIEATGGNRKPDVGEPRSELRGITVGTNDVWAPDVTVVDDLDGDGLPDWWEVRWFGSTNRNGDDDYDNDGMTDREEYELSTTHTNAPFALSPMNWDSDEDGMADGWEVSQNDTDAFSPVLSNAGKDADGDGLLDIREYAGVDGQAPLVPSATPGVAATNADDTGDGLNPLDIDTDGDGLLDSFEAAWKRELQLDPNVSNQVDSVVQGDADSDGLTAFREQCLLEPLRSDGSNDIWTGWTGDPSTLTNRLDPALALGAINYPGSDIQALTNASLKWTDPTRKDTDGDTLPDGWEVEFGLNPRTYGRWDNPDGDTNRNNDLEFTIDHSNPNRYYGLGLSPPNAPVGNPGYQDGKDTDDDGIDDGDADETHPCNSLYPHTRRSAYLTNGVTLLMSDPEKPLRSGPGFRPDLVTSNWTLECYVRVTDTNSTADLIEIPGPADPGWPATNLTCRLWLSNGIPCASFVSLSHQLVSVDADTNRIAAGEWLYLAATWAPNTLSLYVGTNDVPYQIAASNENACISGSYASMKTRPRFGVGVTNDLWLDEIRIWGEARTPAEIEADRRFLITRDDPNLLAYFPFDDGGDSAEDFTKKARSSLVGPAFSNDYAFGDFAFAITNTFELGTVTNAAPIHLSYSFSVALELYPPEGVPGPGGGSPADFDPRWRIDDGEWREAGAADEVLPGTYTISYTNMAPEGQRPYPKAPPPETIEVKEGQVNTHVATFSRATGTVRVDIFPPEVRSEARWQLGFDTYEHGNVTTQVTGQAIVTFSRVEDWVEPEDMTVFFQTNGLSVYTGTYSRAGIRVFIEPPAIEEQARWQLAGSTNWYRGNKAGDPPLYGQEGQLGVLFSSVDGWVSPDNVVATFEGGRTNEYTGLYERVTFSGDIKNQSMWANRPEVQTPGDGTGQGSIVVGLWTAGKERTSPPATSVVVVATRDIPFPGTHSYGISHSAPGSYSLMAWMDGNANSRFDTGEPRSADVAVAVETSHVTGNTLTVVDDFDGDGMGDWWEIHWFNTLVRIGSEDTDFDGLTNGVEFTFSTTYPNDLAALDPTKWDTDDDGMNDKWEMDYYSNGNGLIATKDDAQDDNDKDGLLNIMEYHGIGGSLNPINRDTDNDTLLDSFEVAWYYPLNGIDPHTAGDPAADPDGDGLSNRREQCLLAPLWEGRANDTWSSTNLFTTNLWLVSTNTTYIDEDARRELQHTRAYSTATNGTWTDPSDWDSDGDLLPDGWEVEFGLNPMNAIFGQGFHDDPDGDGLMNHEEYLGQDGKRATEKEYVDGSGDETNPMQHNWRPPSTPYSGIGVSRDTTPGGALPTKSLGHHGGYDTDDDGLSDLYEIHEEYVGGYIGSSPVHSMHPFVRRAARITDNRGIVIPSLELYRDPFEPGVFYHRPDLHAREWTIECYVKLRTSDCSGYLINHYDMPETPDRYIVYRLALSNSVPRVELDTIGGTNYCVEGSALATNRWIHLAGTFDPDQNTLSLQVDGVMLQAQRVYQEGVCRQAEGAEVPLTIAESPNGTFKDNLWIDEVRIWTNARSPEQIEFYRRRLVPQDETNLVAYFRFDDGGTSAEDFKRKGINSLLGTTRTWYSFGDTGYALTTNYFEFVGGTNAIETCAAPVLGIHPLGADDSDGDGMPDGWELVNHLDPSSHDGTNDTDGDTLPDVFEFWAQTNPRDHDTDRDEELDISEDLDGDLFDNHDEVLAGTRPDMADTDDDGITDRTEASNGTDPLSSRSPGLARAVRCGGGPGDYVEVPVSFDQRLSSWTLEAWVNPLDTTGADGIIVRRALQHLGGGAYSANFVLGLKDSVGRFIPYAGYITPEGEEKLVYGDPVSPGKWIHLAASYDSLELSLFTNGVQATAVLQDKLPPLNGKAGETFVRIGEHLAGDIDEVRIWNVARSAEEIADHYMWPVNSTTNALQHYFAFDDGEACPPTQTNAYHQPRGAEDSLHPRDWTNQWIHAAELHGNVEFTDSGIVPPATAVRVVLGPEQALSDGALWQVLWSSTNSSGWKTADEIVHGLEPGEYRVSYDPVSGWTAPATNTFTISDERLVELTANYAEETGIRLSLFPEATAATRMMWRVDGGDWTDDLFVQIGAGSYTVDFKAVEGWGRPGSVTVDVTNGHTRLRLPYCGMTVLGEGVFAKPRGIVVDAGRTLYVADAGYDCIWSLDHPYTGSWSKVEGDQDLNQPQGLALDAQGNLYVADRGQARILKRTPANVWDSPLGVGTFLAPWDVAVDAAQNLYVADSASDTIWKKTPTTGWTSFTDGIAVPYGVAVDGSNNVYVTDYPAADDGRVRKYSSSGSLLGDLGGDFDRCVGSALSSSDSLFVVDQDAHSIARRAGAEWSSVAGSGELVKPWYAFVDDSSDYVSYLYVSDSNRVLRFSLPDQPYVELRFDGTGTWHGIEGWFYDIQFRDSLSSSSLWENLPGHTNLAGTNGPLTFTDDGAGNAARRFYRIRAH